MMVGQDVSIGGDHEARANGLAFALARLTAIVEQVAEDLRHLLEVARIDIGRHALRHWRLLRAQDLHHRTRILFHDLGEIRQRRRPGVGGTHENQGDRSVQGQPIALHVHSLQKLKNQPAGFACRVIPATTDSRTPAAPGGAARGIFHDQGTSSGKLTALATNCAVAIGISPTTVTTFCPPRAIT